MSDKSKKLVYISDVDCNMKKFKNWIRSHTSIDFPVPEKLFHEYFIKFVTLN